MCLTPRLQQQVCSNSGNTEMLRGMPINAHPISLRGRLFVKLVLPGQYSLSV